MKFDQEMANEYAKGVRRTLPTYDAMYKMVHSYLRQKLVKEASVLIVGAGGGTELEVFGQGNNNWTFTAVDPSESMLSLTELKARELGLESRVTFNLGTVEELDGKRIFDSATSMLVMHFIHGLEEKRSMLNTISRLLKPGAPFILASMFGKPGNDEFEEKLRLWKYYWLDRTKLSEEAVDEMEASIRKLSFLPEEEIRAMLEEAGFERVTKFLETAMFGGWICYKKEMGDEE